MVKTSYHIHNLVLMLIAIQVTHNEAKRMTLEVRNESSNVTTTTHQKVNDEKLFSNNSESLNLIESQALSTVLDARQTDTKARKYSYFYVGAWIWHIPLWFTLWFSFYVAFNVVRAIYGHTIDPNDYERRKRDVHSTPTLDEINSMTNFAMKSFRKYHNKNN